MPRCRRRGRDGGREEHTIERGGTRIGRMCADQKTNGERQNSTPGCLFCIPLSFVFIRANPLNPRSSAFYSRISFGSLALGTLLHQASEASAKPHFPAKAKSVIWL